MTVAFCQLHDIQIEFVEAVDATSPVSSLVAQGHRIYHSCFTVDNLDEAVMLGNLYSPEHMCLFVEEPHKLMAKVLNAGGVFLGESSPEVAGDYIAGPSHVMPTGGTARFNSSLGVHQFLKITSLIGLKAETFHALGQDAARLAEAEGLDGHARAAQIRLERTDGGSQ